MSSSRIGSKDSTPLSQGEALLKPLPLVVKISHVAATALFVGAVGGTVFFAMVPMGPLVPGTSLTVALMTCSVSGGATLIYLTIALGSHRKRVNKKIQRTLREYSIFSGEGVYQKMGRGQDISALKAQKKSPVSTEIHKLGQKKRVNIPTRDGLMLSGVWCTPLRKGQSNKTAILFPPNNIGRTGMKDWLKWYQSNGFNVLVVVSRGYGVSEGSSLDDGELGGILDAEAGLNWLWLNQGIAPDTVIAHGSCSGGALAAALGKYYDVLGVVYDHGFSSFKKVAQSFVFLPPVAAVLSGNMFPKGRSLREDLSLPEGWLEPKHAFVTDGLDSAKKLAEINAHTFAIQGSCDCLAPKKHGKALVKEKGKLIHVPGGHQFNALIENACAAEKFIGFLNDLYSDLESEL